MLLPLGDHLLIESKAGFSDTFVKNAQGDYGGAISYGLSYAQADYITKYATLTAGRFITPFNMYGERLAPNWIRDLQTTPMSVGITSGAALGGMVRGGLPLATDRVHLNYATYFSTANTNHILATDRSAGGRIGFFLPGPRLEIGASFQQLLQQDRSHAAGTHLNGSRMPSRLLCARNTRDLQGHAEAATGLKPLTGSARSHTWAPPNWWVGGSSSLPRQILLRQSPGNWALWALIRMRATGA